MTTRLLHRTFGAGDGYEPPRRALHERRSGTRITLGPGEATLRIGPLPLIRKIDGARYQAIRIDLEGAEPSTSPLRVSLVDGDVDLASGEVADAGPLNLWVPVVDRDEVVAVHVDGLARGEVTVTPQREWTVHLIHHSHLDIGYTDPQGVVLRHHLEYLDAALRLCETTDDRRDDTRFRWSVESILPAIRWLEARPAHQVARFLERVREGRIELTALPFQLHTEACSEEELRRILRFATRLRADHEVRIDSAMHTDVCGAVVGMVDALSDAGVRYLSAAHNWAGRSVPYLTGGTDLSRPFWWRSAAGNRLLVWFTDTAHGMAYMEGNIVGFTDSYGHVEDLLPAYLDGVANRYAPYGPEVFGWNGGMEAVANERPPYPYDVLHLRVQGAHADNAGPSPLPADIAHRWNETYEWPRLVTSTNNRFFEEMEARYGDALPEFRGDWTDWWADGMASGARPLGWTRRAQATLRRAESVHALADLRSGSDACPEDRLDAAYDDVALFDEHTWGAANPWDDDEEGFGSGQKQWTWKQALAIHASDQADDLIHGGVRRLGAAIAVEAETASLHVVNLGPGRRTDLVRAFVPASVVPLERDVVVTDGRTGEPCPTEVEAVRPEEQPTRPAGRWLRFLASDVPAVGSARFDLADGEVEADAPLSFDGNLVELGTGDQRVVVDTVRGVITSMTHGGRELVEQDALAGMNECIHDTYASAPFVNHLSGHLQAHGKELLAERQVAGAGSLVQAVRTPLCDRVVVTRVLQGTRWLRTTVEIPHALPRVDVTNRMMKEPSASKESIYFAFPFAATGAAEWELTGGVGGKAIDAVPGSPEHLTFLRHWVAFQEDDLSIAWASLEAPLMHLGDIPLPYAPFPMTLQPERPEPGTIYSWALNNIWDTNFPSQQAGEMAFQYSIAAERGATGREVGMRTAATLTDPLTAVLSSGGPDEDVLLAVDHPRVRVTSIGRGADRAGARPTFAVHLRSVSREPEAVALQVGSLPVRTAWVAGVAGRPATEVAIDDGRIDVEVPAESMLTVELDVAGGDDG